METVAFSFDPMAKSLGCGKGIAIERVPGLQTSWTYEIKVTKSCIHLWLMLLYRPFFFLDLSQLYKYT